MAVTLATTVECSMSNALSGDFSQQLRTRTGFAPSTSFLPACSSRPFRSQWTGDQSLLDARNFGAQGFGLLSEILEESGCYRFAYGDPNEAASAFDALAAAA